LEDAAANLDGSAKIFRNGQLVIIRGGKTFNAIGQEL
jgi:hypothetical protein